MIPYCYWQNILNIYWNIWLNAMNSRKRSDWIFSWSMTGLCDKSVWKRFLVRCKCELGSCSRSAPLRISSFSNTASGRKQRKMRVDRRMKWWVAVSFLVSGLAQCALLLVLVILSSCESPSVAAQSSTVPTQCLCLIVVSSSALTGNQPMWKFVSYHFD